MVSTKYGVSSEFFVNANWILAGLDDDRSPGNIIVLVVQITIILVGNACINLTILQRFEDLDVTVFSNKSAFDPNFEVSTLMPSGPSKFKLPASPATFSLQIKDGLYRRTFGDIDSCPTDQDGFFGKGIDFHSLVPTIRRPA